MEWWSWMGVGCVVSNGSVVTAVFFFGTKKEGRNICQLCQVIQAVTF